jgi:hypothetical protein
MIQDGLPSSLCGRFAPVSARRWKTCGSTAIGFGTAPQFAARDIEDVIGECYSHAICAKRQKAGRTLALFMTK